MLKLGKHESLVVYFVYLLFHGGRNFADSFEGIKLLCLFMNDSEDFPDGAFTKLWLQFVIGSTFVDDSGFCEFVGIGL